jgi:hypothetical protein
MRGLPRFKHSAHAFAVCTLYAKYIFHLLNPFPPFHLCIRLLDEGLLERGTVLSTQGFTLLWKGLPIQWM